MVGGHEFSHSQCPPTIKNEGELKEEIDNTEDEDASSVKIWKESPFL